MSVIFFIKTTFKLDLNHILNCVNKCDFGTKCFAKVEHFVLRLILRMKRAMELLQEGIYNVSEIAYKVGMNDPLYFSKCFKSHFGAPPSAYLHKK